MCIPLQLQSQYLEVITILLHSARASDWQRQGRCRERVRCDPCGHEILKLVLYLAHVSHSPRQGRCRALVGCDPCGQCLWAWRGLSPVARAAGLWCAPVDRSSGPPTAPVVQGGKVTHIRRIHLSVTFMNLVNLDKNKTNSAAKYLCSWSGISRLVLQWQTNHQIYSTEGNNDLNQKEHNRR